MDLRDGASVAGALNAAGFDTWLVDWGAPEDEDRYLTWDDVLDRLDRMVRRVKRLTGAPKVACWATASAPRCRGSTRRCTPRTCRRW